MGGGLRWMMEKGARRRGQPTTQNSKTEGGGKEKQSFTKGLLGKKR